MWFSINVNLQFLKMFVHPYILVSHNYKLKITSLSVIYYLVTKIR